MKLSKIFLAFSAAACIGMIVSAAGLATSEGEKVPENSLIGQEGSYGSTLTKIIATEERMFSHRDHVIGFGLECDSCHTDTFKKKRGSALAAGDYTMKSLEEGKYCGVCHDDDTAFGVTEPDTCVTCHGSDMNPPKIIVFEKPVKAVVFDHAMHTDMGLTCNDCHNKLFKMKLGSAEAHPEEFTMEALYTGKYCGSCHDGNNAFASDSKCTSCHIGVKGYNRLFPDKADKGGQGEGGH